VREEKKERERENERKRDTENERVKERACERDTHMIIKATSIYVSVSKIC